MGITPLKLNPIVVRIVTTCRDEWRLIRGAPSMEWGAFFTLELMPSFEDQR